MAEGPGKYDDLCTLVREGAQAEVAIVIVINGVHGSGFSVQGVTDQEALTRVHLPALLEDLARRIRASGGH